MTENAPLAPIANPPPDYDRPPRTEGSWTKAMRWGLYSIWVNLALILLHGAVALASGSFAVKAELLHNSVDLVSSAVLVVGLKLAMRKSQAFAYGLYKVENLVAAGLAFMIFYTAYEIVHGVFFTPAKPPSVNGWMFVLLAITTTAPLIFSHFELRVAKESNSPSLLADAREYRIHAYTTGLAFTALLTAWVGFPLDQIAALIIVVAVVKTGWDLLADAILVLLDASLNRKSLDKISGIIKADPAVAEVKWVTGRSAGQVRFVEAGVALRLTDMTKAEVALTRIEQAVRAAIPKIERALFQIEPPTTHYELYAVPLTDQSGTISEHFGEAPYFAFLLIHREKGTVEEKHILANPYWNEARRKGLRVAEWLVAQKVDHIIVPRDLEGKGPAYVFREAGIQVEHCPATSVEELFTKKDLKR